MIKDPMLFIWEKTSKPEADGKRFITWKNKLDLEYLYNTGFVDADKYSVEEWVAAYEDSKQPDGSYRVTLDRWIAKKKFRYNGSVEAPFDPASLKEGNWSLAEFDKLVKEKLLPAIALPKGALAQAMEKLKKNFSVGGQFVFHPAFKNEIQQLLLQYPSPRRVRELSVAEAKKQSSKKTPPTTPQPSGFKKGPSSEKQMKDKLNHLLKKT